jgi:hypothetical protein
MVLPLASTKCVPLTATDSMPPELLLELELEDFVVLPEPLDPDELEPPELLELEELLLPELLELDEVPPPLLGDLSLSLQLTWPLLAVK